MRALIILSLAAALLLGRCPLASAQAAPHEGHAMPGAAQPESGMAAAFPRFGTMERIGSGTAWQPDASPMFARHRLSGRWMVMFHANGWLLYDRQTGPRGATRLVAPNWLMWMEGRPLGRGELLLTQMFSLDPATVRPRGYPELFQVGETFRGEPLTDAQHPHDFFMALSAQYTHPVSRRCQAMLYAAPVGEPALGPVAYPHRSSSLENPVAPLGHHWQDSTHITFGVLTAGLQSERWRVEGSWFNGEEPDENRWDFDPIQLNSGAARIQYMAGPRWHMQLSRGWLKAPEALEPNDVTRTTASLSHTRSWESGFSAMSLVWGHNEQHQGGPTSDVFSLEGTHQWRRANNLWWRVENADRTELFHTGPLAHQVFNVNAFTVGYTRDISRSPEWAVGLGGALTFYAKPDALDPAYGKSPLGLWLFLRVRPTRASMDAHGH